MAVLAVLVLILLQPLAVPAALDLFQQLQDLKFFIPEGAEAVQITYLTPQGWV